MDVNVSQGKEHDTATWNLDQIVTELRTSRELTHNIRLHGLIRELPSRKALLGIVDGLCGA
jgi:serine O-acetyltransferase